VGQLTGEFQLRHGFLPRDTMLALYMLSSCVHLFVCLSVHHKLVFYWNN